MGLRLLLPLQTVDNRIGFNSMLSDRNGNNILQNKIKTNFLCELKIILAFTTDLRDSPDNIAV